MSDARETIADIVTRGGYTADPTWSGKQDALEDSDAVIAHLWQKADDPQVIEAVAMMGREQHMADYPAKNPIRRQQRSMAARDIQSVLTALIGPDPRKETSNE